MKHYRTISSVLFTCAVLTCSSLSVSAAQLSDTTIEIVEIQEIPGSTAPEQSSGAQTSPSDPQTDRPVSGSGAPASSDKTGQTGGTPTEQRFGTAMTEAPNTPAESETEPVTEKVRETESEPVTEEIRETESEPVTEEIRETESELVTEETSETESEPATEAESETEEMPEDTGITQGLYEIASAPDTGFVIDIRHCTVQDADSKSPQLYRSLDINQQKFYIEALPDGFFRISVLHTGDTLTFLPESNSVVMAAMEHPDDGAAAASQSWIIEEARYGYYYIRTENGQYLTFDSFRPYSGASVILSGYTGGVSQMWRLDDTWISTEDCADTDLVNPYCEDGPFSHLCLTLQIGTHSETITADDLSEHITENESHEYVLDPEYIDSFVSRLAAQYDTLGQPKRFCTSHGDEITLYEGNIGRKLDTEATKALIQESLKTDHIKFLSPVWEQETWSDADNSIGDSYVEVDLISQKVWLYKDGEKLLETDCVSGAEDDPESYTPGGVYGIYYMQSPDTLNGPGYSEDVSYWMAFLRGFGLHDATWRSEFGGNIYQTDGSHGCINLPLEAAELIYKTVDIGYPVVLYR